MEKYLGTVFVKIRACLATLHFVPRAGDPDPDTSVSFVLIAAIQRDKRAI
jgi:hypothetical protein